MAVSSVSQNYTAYLYQWKQQQLQSTNTNGAGSSETTGSSSSTSTYSGKSTVASLVELAQYAMDSMGVAKGSRVTFSQIQAYKSKIEQDFSDAVKKGLETAGVSKDVAFRLSLDDDGKIQVASDDADKDKVQKFFDDNPDLAKKYEKIQALSNLDSARKAMSVNPGELRKRIEIESMASWWESSGNSTSTIGLFSGGNMSTLAGLKATV